MRLKFFLCYASENEGIALKVQSCLSKCIGADVFMAKANLNFSEDWLNDIWLNLNKSDFLIPLISEDLNISAFANQEIGVALVKSIKIIPLSIDGSDPKGFISKYQAHKYTLLNEDSILDFVIQVYFNIFNDPKLKPWINSALDSLVHAFCDSDSFNRTSIVLKLIIRTSTLIKLKRNHIAKIVTAAKENPMIHNTDYLFPMLKDFLEREYNVIIDK